MRKYTFDNFFLFTVANWIRCEIPDRPPDYISYSGSVYWDYGDRVRRCSDHWGPNIASCKWYLEFRTLNLKNAVCGECLYEDFRSVHLL